MAVYGIDLGTTYSCIAQIDDVGRPTVLRNQENSDTTPSVVFFETPDNVVVGATAKDSAVVEPDLVVSTIKRDMGHDVTRTMHGREYTPEEISAFVLRKLAADAEIANGQAVTDVVITVPAYFGAAERDATLKAGKIAGLNVVDIVSEPVAAAIAYGVLNSDQDCRILIYDLGGGTFDTTMINLHGGDIEVVCTDGNHKLGGVDWDDRLVVHLAERFRAEHSDVSDPLEDRETEQQLRSDAEELKKTLSSKVRHTLRMTHEGLPARIELTREDLESLTRDLLDQTIEITRRTIETARSKGVDSIDHLLLVGGSAKMPAVAKALHKAFGVTPQLLDPDLVVAKGAALYAFEETYRRLVSTGNEDEAEKMATRAGLSSGRREQIANRVIKRVASHSFGIKTTDRVTRREYVTHLVHANDPIPTVATESFATLDDFQTGVEIVVMEQAGVVESEKPEDNTRIGGGVLKIPPNKLAGHPIAVKYELDASGLLSVKARELETGKELELDFEVGFMPEEEVARSKDALSRVKVS